MISAGIDPGSIFGWGIVEVPGDRVLAGGQAPKAKRGQAMEVLRTFGGTLAAIEDQYVIDNRRMPFPERRAKQADAITLAHDAGEWHMWLSLQGWTPCYVDVPTWRRAYTQGRYNWTKAEAVDIARRLFFIDLKDSQEHFAEALLIARWRGIEALHRARVGNIQG